MVQRAPSGVQHFNHRGQIVEGQTWHRLSLGDLGQVQPGKLDGLYPRSVDHVVVHVARQLPPQQRWSEPDYPVSLLTMPRGRMILEKESYI